MVFETQHNLALSLPLEVPMLQTGPNLKFDWIAQSLVQLSVQCLQGWRLLGPCLRTKTPIR